MIIFSKNVFFLKSCLSFHPVNPDSDIYSYFKAFTGFRRATLQVCELTVSKATVKAMAGPIKNAQYGIEVWKKNLPRKIFPKIKANGKAIKNAIISHLI